MKYNKAETKLQVRNVKQQAKAAQPKKTTKKAAKKKRNGRLFRSKQAQIAKQKAANAAANKAANLISAKNKLIIGGVAAGILLVAVLPMFLLIGGGGSMGSAGGGGGAIGATVYPPSTSVLTGVGIGCNKVLTDFYNDCAAIVGLFNETKPIESCDHSEECSHSSTTYVFDGVNGEYRYDIHTLCQYLTALYRDGTDMFPNDDDETALLKAWLAASAEAQYVVREMWTFKLVSTDDYKNTNCQHITGFKKDDDGNEIPQYDFKTSHTIVYHYAIVSNPDFNLHEYIDDMLSKIGEKDSDGNVKRDKDGNTDGQAHYNILQKSGGAKQMLSSPMGDDSNWIDSCSVFGTLPEQEDTRENCIGVKCGSGKEIVAGFNGTITNKGSDFVEISYSATADEHTYTVTYYGGNTSLPNGATVESGTYLFTTGGGTYNLELSVYDTTTSQYINPVFIFYANSKQENGELD